MKSLDIVVEHTAETIHPMHAFVCESPAVERELLLEGRPGTDVRTLLFYVEGDADAYESVLAERSDAEYDIRPDDEGGFFMYVRAPNDDDGLSFLTDAFEQETAVVVPPVEFRADRTMRLQVVGHADDLRALLDALGERLSVDVLSVGPFTRGLTPTLTAQQRSALAAAWEAGYYEVPRQAGLEAVAAALDASVSATSTLLRRAESRLVADALGRRN